MHYMQLLIIFLKIYLLNNMHAKKCQRGLVEQCKLNCWSRCACVCVLVNVGVFA